MYLSKLTLNRRSWHVRRDLANLQDLHRTIMATMPLASTPGTQARRELGVLYRVDEASDGAPVVLVQSLTSPDWSLLPESYVLDRPQSKSVERAYDSIRSGDVLVFRLLANPTRRATGRRVEGLRNEAAWEGKRIELVSEREQLEWLSRQAGRLGFALEPVGGAPTVSDVRVSDMRKRRGYRRGARMSFGSVLFEGRLRVVDAEAFRDALTRGVGRGKAYGFGLLSVARRAS